MQRWRDAANRLGSSRWFEAHEVDDRETMGLRFVTEIISVDEVNSVVAIDLEVYLHWQQQALKQPDAKPGFHPFDPEVENEVGVLRPRIQLVGVIEENLIEESFHVDGSTGDVVCLLNWAAVFRVPMELKSFPFDRQCFSFILESQFFALRPWELGDDNSPEFVPYQTMSVTTLLDMWRLHAVTAMGSRAMGTELFVIKTFAARNPHYYFWNIIAVMFLIIMCSSLIFAVDVHDTADRAGIALTLLLTAVAYKFVIASELPKIGYLTLLDKYMIFSFAVLAVGIGEVFLVSERMTADVDEANSVDSWFYSVFPIAWVCLHVVIIAGERFSMWSPSWESVETRYNLGGQEQSVSGDSSGRGEIDFDVSGSDAASIAELPATTVERFLAGKKQSCAPFFVKIKHPCMHFALCTGRPAGPQALHLRSQITVEGGVSTKMCNFEKAS
jgi:hypothetical protein